MVSLAVDLAADGFGVGCFGAMDSGYTVWRGIIVIIGSEGEEEFLGFGN